MTCILWAVQALLALVFVFAGGFKLIMPVDALTTLVPLPGLVGRAVAWPKYLAGSG